MLEGGRFCNGNRDRRFLSLQLIQQLLSGDLFAFAPAIALVLTREPTLFKYRCDHLASLPAWSISVAFRSRFRCCDAPLHFQQFPFYRRSTTLAEAKCRGSALHFSQKITINHTYMRSAPDKARKHTQEWEMLSRQLTIYFRKAIFASQEVAT